MFDYELLTARTVSFTDSDNRAIQGVQLWIICKTSDPKWGDCEVVKLWISSTSQLYQLAKALRLWRSPRNKGVILLHSISTKNE